jgi:hypothetical protein
MKSKNARIFRPLVQVGMGEDPEAPIRPSRHRHAAARIEKPSPKRSPVAGKGMSLYDPEAVFLTGNG